MAGLSRETRKTAQLGGHGGVATPTPRWHSGCMKLLLGEGGEVDLRIDAAEGAASNGLELSGLALVIAPDGNVQLSVERLAVRNLQMQAGRVSVAVGEAVVTGVVAALGPTGTGEAAQLRGVSAAQLRLQ